MIWKQLCYDTQNQNLQWKLIDDEGNWSATSDAYSVRVHSPLPFLMQLTVRTKLHWYTLTVSYWKWCKLKRLMIHTDRMSQEEMVKEMRRNAGQ